MPLHVLLPLVVVGIAGIALLTHLLGLSRAGTLRSASQARAAWEREYPQFPACSATLSGDGHAALLDTGEAFGLVWIMGADTTARPLAGADIRPTPFGLSIRFDDFAAPLVDVRLNETCDIDSWRALITQSPETLMA